MTHRILSQAEDRLFYGYRLRTDLPLTSLRSLPREGPADIELISGDVPVELPAAIWRGPFVQIGGAGDVLLRVGDHIRFRVVGGRQIIVNAAALPDAGDVETMLLGSVAGIVLHQRGDLALHASCVVIGDRALVIAGPAGRGKSTLAALLAAQGFPVLTDDICRVCFSDARTWTVPGSSRLRLWPDGARMSGHSPEALAPGRSGHPKRLLVLPAMPPGLVPLGAVVRLQTDNRLEGPCLTRVSGMATLRQSDEILYRARLGRRLGRRAGLFQDLTRLAGLVPIFSLTRTDQPSQHVEIVRLLIAMMKDLP
ncbi:MAG: serine kinase [Azospirillaceae bacterium]|nr:serine kinase [Azospirillaceae bacterium]